MRATKLAKGYGKLPYDQRLKVLGHLQLTYFVIVNVVISLRSLRI